MQTCVTGLIGALSLLLPPLALTGHLRALHLVSHRALIFDALLLKLTLMHIGSLNVLVSATVIAFFVISCLLLLDNIETRVIIDQFRLGDSTGLLLLLYSRLSRRHKRGSLRCSEVAELANPILLVVRLEKLAVKLILEIEALTGRSKALALIVEAERLQVKF